MTGTLVRRDPALMTLLKTLPFALAHGYTWSLSARPAVAFMWLFAMWALVLAHLLFGRADERSGEFAMGLPVAARRLWLLRAGVLAGTSLLLVVGVAVFPLAGERAPLGVFLNLGAAVLLAVVWIQSWAPGKNSLLGWGFVLYSAAGLVGAIWLSMWLVRGSAWLALAPLGAAVLLGVRTYMAVPQGFELDRRTGTVEVTRATAWEGRLLIPRLLYEWHWWGLFVMFFLVGMLRASEEALPIMVFALATSLAPVALKLPQVGHLPISRRRLFAWATLPAVFCFFAGLLAGGLIHGPRGPRSWLMVYEPGGPETLRFVHLRAELAVVAVLVVLGGLVWLGMVLVQVARQGSAARDAARRLDAAPALGRPHRRVPAGAAGDGGAADR